MSSEAAENGISLDLLIGIFSLLIIMNFVSLIAEHYKFHFLQESTIGIILGIIVGFISSKIDGSKSIEFENEFFFVYLLPPIIFAAGYNLKRRRFFKNFGYIFMFGILGTMISFFTIFSLTWAYGKLDLVYINKSSDAKRNEQTVSLGIEDCLYLAAATCATDTVASLSVIKQKEFPKLFSIIFGESMLNDVIAIILFQAIKLMGKNNYVVNDSTSEQIISDFFKILFLSAIIGLAIGLFLSFLLKKAYKLHKTSIFEISVVFFFGLLGYFICDYLKLSGILSLLVSGIIMGHYAYYNITTTSKLATGITFQTVSNVSEQFLFIYLGLACMSTKDLDWSISFIFAEFVILLISRLANIFIISLVFWIIYKIMKLSWDLDLFELTILYFAGSIRGAVAFALILTARSEHKNEKLLRSTTYVNLMVSTVLMGGLMPYILKLLVRFRTRYYPTRAMSNNSEITEIFIKTTPAKIRTPKAFMHHFWKVLDEKYLKPFFIADYVTRREDIHTERLIRGREKYRVELNVCNEFENFKLPLTIKEESFVIENDEKENNVSVNSPEASNALSKFNSSNKVVGSQRLTVPQKYPLGLSENTFSLNSPEEKDIFHGMKGEKAGKAQDDSSE